MKQKDKKLLLKDLCARLPYRVKVQRYSYENDIETIETLREIDSDGYMATLECDTLMTISKPYLFPLSSMTEEQKRELLELTGYESRCEESYGFDSWGFYVNIVGEYEYENNQESIILYPDYIGIDWLNKNHFDYRGLIPKGLANDATGKGIY